MNSVPAVVALVVATLFATVNAAVVYESPEFLCQVYAGNANAGNETAWMRQVTRHALIGNGTYVQGIMNVTAMVPYFNGTLYDGSDYYTSSADFEELYLHMTNLNMVLFGCKEATTVAITTDASVREIFTRTAVRNEWIDQMKLSLRAQGVPEDATDAALSEYTHVDAVYGRVLREAGYCGLEECDAGTFNDYAEVAAGVNGSSTVATWINEADPTGVDNTVKLLVNGSVSWRMKLGEYGVEQTDADYELLTGGFDSGPDTVVFTIQFTTVGTYYYRSHHEHDMHGIIEVVDYPVPVVPEVVPGDKGEHAVFYGVGYGIGFPVGMVMGAMFVSATM